MSKQKCPGPECDNVVWANGYCNAHNRQLKKGRVLSVLQPRGAIRATTEITRAAVVVAAESGLTPDQIQAEGIASRSVAYRILKPLGMIESLPRRPEVPVGMHFCGQCRNTKSEEVFGLRNGVRRRSCKDCENIDSTLYKKNNPDKVRAVGRRCNLRRKYGLTVEEYSIILNSQDGVCAICRRLNQEKHGVRKNLSVDHDHSNGKLRGLLCQDCNIAIGKAKDNPDLLCLGADYRDFWDRAYESGFCPPALPEIQKIPRRTGYKKRVLIKDLGGKRVCSSCLVSKETSLFGKRSSGGKVGVCLECDRNRAVLAYQSDPEGERRKDLSKYGVTLEYYEALLSEQGGVCSICYGVNSDGKALFVDHIHDLGKHAPRGLLCLECNWFIDRLGSSETLRAAAAYLVYWASQV